MDHFLNKRQECISCDGAAPVCNCAANEQCILTGRSCNQCPSIECVPNASSGGKSINPGVIAGPVVAALVILGVVALWWLRKKRRRDLARVEELAQRARKAEAAGFHLSSNPGSPGPGSARSARSDRSSQRHRVESPRSPDPNAPVNAEWYDENGQLRPLPHRNGNGDDPFSDRQSVSTTGTDARSDHVIPIKYLPRAPSDEALSRTLRAGAPADAARALDEARNNLFKHGHAPARPARSPDLDLRLNPTAAQNQYLSPPSSFHDVRSPSQAGTGTSGYRDSYLSGNSGAPSYLSGSTDIHLDAPKIVTSRQVQIGRLQQAEVVQLGRPQHAQNMESLDRTTHGDIGPPSPSASSSRTNPFGGGSDDSHLHPQAPLSPATFGSRTLGSEVSGVAYGSPSYRTLTPVSYRTNGAEEDLRTDEAPSSSTDLRFSMGSFAQTDTARDSISTMGTGRYLAQAVPPPRQPGGSGNTFHRDPRESMASSRSAADSVLHGFPMIPPGQSNAPYHSPIPQSTSVSTLEHAAMPSRPPTSYRQTQTPGTGGNDRNTQASVGLGNFPFVPPPRRGSDDSGKGPQVELPSAALPTGVATDGPPTLPHPTRGRNTMGMSTTSEGLGGFDFSFDGAPQVPNSK